MSQDWNRYGPTAARPAGAKPGRMVRPQSVTIDIHSHVAVPRAAEFVKPHLDPATIPLARYATPDTKAINVRQDARAAAADDEPTTSASPISMPWASTASS